MRLSEFIRANREQILSEWEAFASTLLPAADAMNSDELRDHAEEMLIAIEQNLEEPQSKEEQAQKAQGKSDSGPASSQATAHGSLRAGTGFTMVQMVSEFRALRASVLRLWGEAVGTEGADVEEINRFNEAIDEALAVSTKRFTDGLAQAKELFLGILAHDLGDPVGAITTSANLLLSQLEAEGPQGKTATRILRSSVRMQEIIRDLHDFIQTRMGAGIPITRSPTDLKDIFPQVIQTLGAAFPDSEVKLELGSDLEGAWDATRLSQALSNLLAKAIQSGDQKSPLTVTARGKPAEVLLSIHRGGPAIAEDLGQIFAPPPTAEPEDSSSQLGLGMYLAQEIIVAHGGRIEVESTEEDGTTFTVRLPRSAAPKNMLAS